MINKYTIGVVVFILYNLIAGRALIKATENRMIAGAVKTVEKKLKHSREVAVELNDKILELENAKVKTFSGIQVDSVDCVPLKYFRMLDKITIPVSTDTPPSS